MSATVAPRAAPALEGAQTAGRLSIPAWQLHARDRVVSAAPGGVLRPRLPRLVAAAFGPLRTGRALVSRAGARATACVGGAAPRIRSRNLNLNRNRNRNRPGRHRTTVDRSART